MNDSEVAYFRKRMTDREAQRIIDGEEMSEDLVRLICASNDGYDTPELNDKLYLHFKGFSRICNLEAFTACRSLWLESNRIEAIENIGHMKELASLFLHNNRIKVIQGLDSFADLVTLNLSSNLIERVEGLGGLRRLQTLNLSKNLLTTPDTLAGLSEAPSITNLDLSSNNIADPETLEVFKSLQDLTQLCVRVSVRLPQNPVPSALCRARDGESKAKAHCRTVCLHLSVNWCWAGRR
jgi:hypothetical protein